MPNISLWTRVMVEQSQTQTLGALKSITASTYGVANGVFAFVPGLGLFQYSPASSATADDINVVQPTSGTGRWLRVTQAAPTVNSNGQLLLSNIDLGVYEATVNGDGSADFLSVYDAFTAGFYRLVVTGDTIEPNSFVFVDTQYDISITILPGVKIDCGALNNVYDASTNGALVNFYVRGVGIALRNGFVWSPTTNGAVLFKFNSAQPGSRVVFDSAYIDASAATAATYHAFVAGPNISFFGDEPGFGLSDTNSSFIEAYNIFLNLPLLLGSGTNCAGFINSPNADVCNISNPIFVNQFSSSSAVIIAKNLTLRGGLNITTGNLLIDGNYANIADLTETFPPLSFDLSVNGESIVSNCRLPNGTLFLSSTSTYTAADTCLFKDLNESANPTSGEVNVCNTTFLDAQSFGTGEKVTWNFTNVNVLNEAIVAGRDVTWNGGAVGSSTTPYSLTINAGALNALVTNVRTSATITNNEPSAMLGTNPLFA